jgi:hypothetical protein
MSKHCKTAFQNGWEVQIARSLQHIDSICELWQQMQSQQYYPVTNTDINRYLSVLKQQDEQTQPFVMLFRKDAKPVAILIARLKEHTIQCQVGYKILWQPSVRCLIVVYGGILGQVDEKVSLVILHELKKILRERTADAIFFNHLHLDSPMYKVVTTVPSFLCRSHFLQPQLHWQTLIPKSEQEFGKLISKKQQRDLARCSRNLEKAGGGPVKVVCYHQKEELEHFINAASQIYALTYHRGLKVGFVNNPLTRSLLEQAAADKWLRAYLLYAGSEPVAFEVGCVYGNVYFAEHAGFNPHWKAYSPGILLQLKIFEDLNHEGGVDIYDYGFGDAAYKQRYGNVSWPESSIYIFAPRLYPILLNLALTSTSAASGALNYLVTKAGVYNWVKRHWRALLRKRAAPANNQEVN